MSACTRTRCVALALAVLAMPAAGQRLDLTPTPSLGPGSSPALASLATGLRGEADALRAGDAAASFELAASVRTLAAALLERADALGPAGSLHGVAGLALESRREAIDAALTRHPEMDDLHRLVLAGRLRALAGALPDEPDALARALRDALAPSLELLGARGDGGEPMGRSIDAWLEAGVIDGPGADRLRALDATLGEASRWAAYGPWARRLREVVRGSVEAVRLAVRQDARAREPLVVPMREALGALLGPEAGTRAEGLAALERVGARARMVGAVAEDAELLTATLAMLGAVGLDEAAVDARVRAMGALIGARDAPAPGGAALPRPLRPAHAALLEERRRLGDLLDRALLSVAVRADADWRGSLGVAAAARSTLDDLERLARVGAWIGEEGGGVRPGREAEAARILDATRPVQRSRTRGETERALAELNRVVAEIASRVPAEGAEVVAAVARGEREVRWLSAADAGALLGWMDAGDRGEAVGRVVRAAGATMALEDLERAAGPAGLASARLGAARAWGARMVGEGIATLRAGAAVPERDEGVIVEALARIVSEAGREGGSADDGLGVLVACATLVVPVGEEERAAWLRRVEVVRYAAELGMDGRSGAADGPSGGVMLEHAREAARGVLSAG